jgi:uncharacterized membrane protein
MAAQEKTKAATAPPPPNRAITAQSQDFDLLGPPPPSIEHITPAAPPAYNNAFNAVPPAYNAGLFAPTIPMTAMTTATMMEPPPPAFDAVENTVMSQLAEPPPSYFMPPPPVASAPALEDLLPYHDEPPPPFFQAPPPPAEEIIMGMEGLSPEERAALMDEQRKIMEQIERDKLANKNAMAAVQADNFDMRSTAHALSAVGATNNRAPTTRPPSGAVTGNKVNLGGGQEVALHGPERTKEAIKDGTAILVQCVNCENWMQVTGSATLMYCPVCAVVSPIDQTNAAMSKEEAMQMEADRKMAEQLQNEEYEAADHRRPQQRQARSATSAPASTTASTRPAPQQEESWWDTVTGMFSTETKETKPTSPSGSNSATGATHSYPPDASERELGGGTRPAAARVAQRQPLFSCVVDSVNSTVGTLTGTSLSQDREGNVHGVDATSLLAVSNVGRDTEYQQFNSN